MCGVHTPPELRLQDFSQMRESWRKVPLRCFDSMSPCLLKGMRTEEYVSWVLSFFEGEVLRAERGSRSDLMGIDLFLETPLGRTIGIQVKSSEQGLLGFLSQGDLGDRIIVLWVDRENPLSRKALFKWCLKNLPSLGCPIGQLGTELLVKRKKFRERGIKTIPVLRGRTMGFSIEELNILMMLGLSRRDGNTFII